LTLKGRKRQERQRARRRRRKEEDLLLIEVLLDKLSPHALLEVPRCLLVKL